MKILVTGASGFVGSHFMRALQAEGHEVTGTSRSRFDGFDEAVHVIADADNDLSPWLSGVEFVIHAAGVAHAPTRDPDELRDLLEKGNRDWTRKIAAAVAGSDVKGMIHISSIAAAGSPAGSGQGGFRESDESSPQTDYGRSKREAEPAVVALGECGKLGVNFRAPLIYGRGTKGNWPRLLSLAASGLPLPFARVNNRRSYLGIDHLCELVSRVLKKLDQSELSGTYPVADDEPVSLEEVITSLRSGLGRRPALFPFPPGLMRFVFHRLGRPKMAEGLFDDLVIDSSAVKRAFDWAPSGRTLEGMKRSVETPEED